MVLALSVLLSVNIITTVVAEDATGTASTTTDPLIGRYLAFSAALAVGISVMGAAYAIKTTGTAAISVLSENEGGFFKAFLVVALGEALAVYGLIVAILLWTKIP